MEALRKHPPPTYHRPAYPNYHPKNGAKVEAQRGK